MFFRFVVGERDSQSRDFRGIFVAAYDLLYEEDLEPWTRELIRERLDWYEEELPLPPHDRFRSGQAICWFKPDAGRMIQRLWPVALAMRESGVPVRVVRRWDPGRIRYQDRWQVVAVGERTGRR